MAKVNSYLLWYGIAGIILYTMIFSNTANAAPAPAGQPQFTANLESFSPTAYSDGSSGSQQLYSIGYGHQIQPNESYLLSQSISMDQGQQLLQSDMQPILDTLNNSGLQLSNGAMVALSDFGYNEGIGSLNKILATLASQGQDAAQQELLQYVYWHPVPGGPAQYSSNLAARRQQEINIWNQ